MVRVYGKFPRLLNLVIQFYGTFGYFFTRKQTDKASNSGSKVRNDYCIKENDGSSLKFFCPVINDVHGQQSKLGSQQRNA